MESDNDNVDIISPNDDKTYVESQSNNEYNESINNENQSSKFEEMDSKYRFENDVPTPTCVRAYIARLKRESYDIMVFILRSRIGEIKGLSGF